LSNSVFWTGCKAVACCEQQNTKIRKTDGRAESEPTIEEKQKKKAKKKKKENESKASEQQY